MKKQSLIFLGFIFILFSGCATPGQKFIDISYLADHTKYSIPHHGQRSVKAVPVTKPTVTQS